MRYFSVLCCICTIIGEIIVFSSLSESFVINCPPGTIQEHPHPTWRRLCTAAEQALENSDALSTLNFGTPLDDGKINLNSKRQDRDHNYLRFGRAYGL